MGGEKRALRDVYKSGKYANSGSEDEKQPIDSGLKDLSDHFSFEIDEETNIYTFHEKADLRDLHRDDLISLIFHYIRSRL